MANAAVFLIAALSVIGAVLGSTTREYLEDIARRTGGVLTTGKSTQPNINGAQSLGKSQSAPRCKPGEIKCIDCIHHYTCTESGGWQGYSCNPGFFCKRSNPGCYERTNTCLSDDWEAEIDENFICTSSGTFPLLGGNCTEYRACVNGVPYKLNCLRGHTFDINFMSCVSGYTSCPDPCWGRKLSKMLLENKNLYVMCINRKAKLIFNCPGNQERNVYQCGPECTEMFYLPINEKCRIYYVCEKMVKGFICSEIKCPRRTWFNPIKSICEIVPNPPPLQCILDPNVEHTIDFVNYIISKRFLFQQ